VSDGCDWQDRALDTLNRVCGEHAYNAWIVEERGFGRIVLVYPARAQAALLPKIRELLPEEMRTANPDVGDWWSREHVIWLRHGWHVYDFLNAYQAALAANAVEATLLDLSDEPRRSRVESA